jgi:hypothetical protein
VHAEVGYAHAEVSKVELVVWPLRNNPKFKREDEEDGGVGNAADSTRLLSSQPKGQKAKGSGGLLETHFGQLKTWCENRRPSTRQ